ncbi:MAG: MOSC N-terminal beta barrel domain-containing protein [Polyangiaceae bacterium]|nr:MOSC N-terminal beta barrel domain-containing protein [Polyangiaceae bacterium]
MSNGHRIRLVLSVIETDSSFHKELIRGEQVWVGRCLFCQAKLLVPLDGDAGRGVTVEHIIPRHHGGSDDAENLALACASCNGEKGRRHDLQDRNDPRRIEVTRALQERRRQRWPALARPPRWPPVEGDPSPEPPPPVVQAAAVHVQSLHIYPLKSARGIEVSEAQVGDRGFEHDRRFMLVDERGRFLSQRQLPQMALLETEIQGELLVVGRGASRCRSDQARGRRSRGRCGGLGATPWRSRGGAGSRGPWGAPVAWCTCQKTRCGWWIRITRATGRW